MVMFGNGFRTGGMMTMTLLQLTAVPGRVEVAQAVSSGAAAGSTTPGAADRLFAAATTPASAVAASAFAFSWRRNYFSLYPLYHFLLNAAKQHYHWQSEGGACVSPPGRGVSKTHP